MAADRNEYKQIATTINKSQHVSQIPQNINKWKQISTNSNNHQQISTNSNKYQQLATIINKYKYNTNKNQKLMSTNSSR
jgi:hypothetical protein